MIRTDERGGTEERVGAGVQPRETSRVKQMPERVSGSVACQSLKPGVPIQDSDGVSGKDSKFLGERFQAPWNGKFLPTVRGGLRDLLYFSYANHLGMFMGPQPLRYLPGKNVCHEHVKGISSNGTTVS